MEKAEFWTEEQKESLRLALKKYDPETVDRFISHITPYCEAAKATLDLPKITDDKYDKKRMIRRFQNAIEELELIKKEKTMLDYFRVAFQEETMLTEEEERLCREDGGIVAVFNETLLFSAVDYNFWKESIKAKDALENLVKMIEDNLKKTKRPIGKRAKADRAGIIETLAILFRCYLGQPTTNPEGPFHNVVRIAHDALGLPSKDLSRGIANALQSKPYQHFSDPKYLKKYGFRQR